MNLQRPQRHTPDCHAPCRSSDTPNSDSTKHATSVCSAAFQVRLTTAQLTQMRLFSCTMGIKVTSALLLNTVGHAITATTSRDQTCQHIATSCHDHTRIHTQGGSNHGKGPQRLTRAARAAESNDMMGCWTASSRRVYVDRPQMR